MFMGGGAVATTLSALPTASWSNPVFEGETRRVNLHNLHTGESAGVTYWEKGEYLPDAMAEVNHVLRDFRTGEVHPIRPELMDLLHQLSQRVGVSAPFQVISGYRSPQTNASLARPGSGVAHHSLHMQGMAIDIRAPGVDLASLHRAALSMGGGGVGYYPSSDFVHVDVGPVRHWAMNGRAARGGDARG